MAWTQRALCRARWTDKPALFRQGETPNTTAPTGKVIRLSILPDSAAASAHTRRPRQADASAAGGLLWPWPLPLEATIATIERRLAGVTS